MMGDRSYREPSEYVIVGAWGLLSALLGLGTSFVFWAALHRTAGNGIVLAAITSLGVGMVLLGLASERAILRLSLVLFAVTLILGYALGGPEFARLLP